MAEAGDAPLRYFEDLRVGSARAVGPFVIDAAVVDAWLGWFESVCGVRPACEPGAVPELLLHSFIGGVLGQGAGFTALLGIRHASYSTTRSLAVGEACSATISILDGEPVDERLALLRYRIELFGADGQRVTKTVHDVLFARRPSGSSEPTSGG